MSVPLWVTELAADFWATAGPPGPFPRDLSGPAGRALVFTVVEAPGLHLAAVCDWLARLGVCWGPGVPDRRLRACLVARGGAGFAFLDADDEGNERRFSLAHELAHYLRDYWRPRREAARRLGPQVLEVFDGLRPPRPGERLQALLGGVRVGFHTHLLARGAGPAAAAVAESERAADRLAYELLAPAGVALGPDDVAARGPSRPDGRALVTRLIGEFGLPPGPASRYAALLRPPPPTDPVLARLRAVNKLSNSDCPGGK